jgi:hypothetical protein
MIMESFDLDQRVFVCVHGNDIEWYCDDCEELVEQYVKENEQ